MIVERENAVDIIHMLRVGCPRNRGSISDRVKDVAVKDHTISEAPQSWIQGRLAPPGGGGGRSGLGPLTFVFWCGG